jgi:probable phosphoglycerate mutase
MPADAIYLLRHGDSRRDKVRRYIGQSDEPLNANGRRQALAWQQAFRDRCLSRIYCSDLVRSRETARIIAEGRGELVQPLAGLREIDLGTWDGLAVDEVRSRYPGEYRRRGEEPVAYRTPGGESFADLAERVLPLFEEIVHSLSGTVLIVGHAGVNRVILCHILALPLERLFQLGQEYGCLNIIEPGAQGFYLRGMNLGMMGSLSQTSAGRK